MKLIRTPRASSNTILERGQDDGVNDAGYVCAVCYVGLRSEDRHVNDSSRTELEVTDHWDSRDGSAGVKLVIDKESQNFRTVVV